MNFCECISSIDITQFFLYHAYILFSFQIFSSKSKALLFYFPSAGKQNFEIKIERNCFSTLFVSWSWIFFNFAFWFFFFRFSDTLLHHYIWRCNNEHPDYFWLYIQQNSEFVYYPNSWKLERKQPDVSNRLCL